MSSDAVRSCPSCGEVLLAGTDHPIDCPGKQQVADSSLQTAIAVTVALPAARQVSLVTFAAAIAVFLLPFISVSCNGQKFHTFTGRELVMGTDIESSDMFSGAKKTEHVPANPLATFALIAAVAGAIVTFSRKSQSMLGGVLGTIGVALLFALKSKVETDMVNKTQGMVQVQTEYGFWAAVILLGIAAFCSFGLMRRFASMASSSNTRK